MSTLDNQRRILAQKIADTLFTSTKDPHRGELLKLYCKDGLFLGGWCREAAIDQIEKVLKEQQLPQ